MWIEFVICVVVLHRRICCWRTWQGVNETVTSFLSKVQRNNTKRKSTIGRNVAIYLSTLHQIPSHTITLAASLSRPRLPFAPHKYKTEDEEAIEASVCTHIFLGFVLMCHNKYIQPNWDIHISFKSI